MSTGKRRICVVTAARSEYGLLYWLMREIEEDPELELQVVVTGSHLSESAGLTIRVIEEDGFHIAECVDMHLTSDDPVAVGKSMGLCSIGFAEALSALRPDIVVVLGDRYELLPVAGVALVAGAPIAHISGGDVTEGAIDNQVRHALTKMSSLHFPGTQDSARRIIQMGEEPSSVFVVGETGLDNIAHLDRMTRDHLATDLGLETSDRWVLVAYHPETLAPPGQDLANLRQVLSTLDALPDAQAVLTWPNADPGGVALGREMEKWAAEKPARFRLHRSLGQRRFLSMMYESAALVGNSSSAIIEAPSIPLPVVDIGDRQKGRLKPGNVIHAQATADIGAALERALSKEFRLTLTGLVNPYGLGDASHWIKEHLKAADLKGLLKKGFHEIDRR